MSDERIEIADADFARAVPFGFVLDTECRLVVLGGGLSRLFHVAVGTAADDVFTIVRPWRTPTFRTLPVDPTATVVLRARGADLELKGCTLSVDGGRRVAFLASPVVRDIDEFRRRGLQLGDFAPSDATPDLLLSMQATKTALTDAKKLSTSLKAALAEAQAATDAKARFLAMMSHEIRTPLNGFGAMIDLLRDSPMTPEQRDNLATMDRCARSLGVLVNDILEFSKLEAGKIAIERRPTRIAATLSQIVEHFRALAHDRGVELVLRVDCPDHPYVAIDLERVRQVLANLIGNALKFTANGNVVVRAMALDDGTIAIDVQDTGIGIPAESTRALFEPFTQVDASVTRRFGGTGLGLSISRQLARAMGGDVTLVHSDQHGSWFRFTFAAPRCAAPADGDETAAAGADRSCAGATVLVVDDDATNQLIATRLLRRLGIETTVVGDGVQAVNAAGKRRFDLILMDMMMPNLGGADATRQIRAGDGPCRDAPIIAFSAAAFDADRAVAANAGMNGFIEKPARLDSLRALLRTHLPPGDTRPPRPTEPTTPPA